jgi:Leo1-like protein.
LQKEEEKLRQSLRKETKTKRTREKGASSRLSAGYLEGDDDDDEGAISLSAIKNKYNAKKNPAGASGAAPSRNIYSSDEDASDLELRTKKHDKPKRVLQDSDDEDEKSAASRSGSGKSGSDSD